MSNKGNPNWQKNGPSPNPDGRRTAKMKYSSRTLKGSIERFLKRNFTSNKMQELYDELPAQQKLQVLTELLPYHMPKLSAVNIKTQINGLDDTSLDELYKRVTGATEDINFDELMQEPLLLPESKTA